MGDIEQLVMKCNKWKTDSEVMLKAVRADWVSCNASSTLLLYTATLLGGVNDTEHTMMPV
jgi:hypothetical protein